MPNLIDCNGIHPGETINSSELPELAELIPGFDPMNPPVCTRTGRLVEHRKHLDTGRHPLLDLMDETQTKGRPSDVRKIIEQVFKLAAVGIDAAITLYPVDTESYPALRISATWRDATTGEPTDQEVERLRIIGGKAHDEATENMSMDEMVSNEGRRKAMRASIRAIYKEING